MEKITRTTPYPSFMKGGDYEMEGKGGDGEMGERLHEPPLTPPL